MIGIAAAQSTPRLVAGGADRIQGLVGLLDPSALPGGATGGARLASTNVLCEIAELVHDLDRGARRRGSVRVRIGEEPCELGLERTGEALLVTVYGGGPQPVIHLFERRVVAAPAAARIAAELERRLEVVSPHEADRLQACRDALSRARFAHDGRGAEPSVALVRVDPVETLPIAIAAELSLRGSPLGLPSPSSPALRSELLPLLGRGRLKVHAGGTTRELADVHVFLVAEQLASLALETIEAYLGVRPLFRKVQIGGAVCGVRLPMSRSGAEVGDAAALTIGHVGSARPESWTFPALDVGVLARAVVDFGRSLARVLVRHDRSLSHNLRLVEFRARLREISEACREIDRDDALVNAAPESYRAYGRSPITTRTEGQALGRGRLRFVSKWTAAVPAIDLQSTFLAGDSFLVGSSRELCCIDRNTGMIAWTRPTTKGVSVLTPCGLARFDHEGLLSIVDVASGETRASLRLMPRAGAPVTGAVISGPGLPRMLVVSEGKRHLVGVDLEAGEILWRWAARRPGTFRIRRAGRLAIVANGEQALTAIDVVSGTVVWRYCDRLRFTGSATVSDDSLFAIAGDGVSSGRGGARLCHLDPWSGELRWAVDLDSPMRAVGAPLVAAQNVLVTMSGPRGTALVAFDRRTGERRYERDACQGAAAALIVDDVAVINGERGDLVGLDVSTGATRYHHVFTEGAEGDRPRRLEPVLRSGALFVPQPVVQVVRPSDGALLGAVAADLVPDLLRVDERCDVYVAEESGHVSAFSAAARLMLVR